MTTDDSAAGWRDLADQLTPEQVTKLEHFEHKQVPPGLAEPQHHLNYAHKMVELNLARAMHADIPAPADATNISKWTDYSDGEYQRPFELDCREGISPGQRSIGGC